jgi:hypothetical protein
LKQEISKNISTEKGADEFQVRLLKEDGVGLLTTKKEDNYLILDSLDYWYDLIQEEYPKKKKCSCKNEWFNVRFNYIPRAETNDIRGVNVITTCTQCAKVSKAMSVSIDYSPTDELIEKPLTFCQTPKIKYKFTELTSYWSGNNLKDFLQFIFLELQLNVYCWFTKHPDHKMMFEKVSLDKAMQIITVNHRYLKFYFSPGELDISEYIAGGKEKGVVVNDGIWRRDEIIQLSSPFVIVGYGLLYYINYCNQYLDKGNVADKSGKFEEVTNKLKAWLTQKFISKRSANSFDGQEAYEKYEAKCIAEKHVKTQQ